MVLFKATVLACAYLIGATADFAKESCLTPDKQEGVCKPIKECPLLYSLLANRTQATITYLRKTHCGFIGKHPKVCCQVFENSETSANRYDLLPGKDCGWFNEDRINGGEITQIDSYPWSALLKYQKDDQDGFYCGGTLLNERYVLTAAHCINERKLPAKAKLVSVRLGDHNLETNPDCESLLGQTIDCLNPFTEVLVEETHVHEEYNPDDPKRYHDIALVRLKKTIQLDDLIRPVCLPTTPEDYTGRRLIRAGWGIYDNKVASSVKVKGEIVVRTADECSEIFGQELNQHQFCGVKRKGYRLCSGDSGGSAMALDGTNFNHFAVAVASAGSCEGNQTTLYTKISGYVPWIVSKLRP